LVWGGDGTAHDTIDTFVRQMERTPEIRSEKAIGFLRGGSGNGIQDSYEVPLRLRNQVEAYAESMQNDYVVDVDLLEARHGGARTYCQLVGTGFDAQVLKDRAGRTYRRGPLKGTARRGMTAYLGSALQTFARDFHRVPVPMTVRLYNGKYALKGTRVNSETPIDFAERKTRAIEIEAGVRPYYGKMFKICPDVVCNDGYLDLYIYNFPNRRSALLNAFWLWTGRHDRINKKFARGNLPIIERYEVVRAEIVSPEPFLYHVDGDLMNTTYTPRPSRSDSSVSRPNLNRPRADTRGHPTCSRHMRVAGTARLESPA
jgi:diacylglycerol kinase family enzyme